MLKKANKKVFVCEQCGNEFAKWAGKCSICESWNTLKEITYETADKSSVERAEILSLDQIDNKNFVRLITGIEEFDLVLGGGIVPGEVLLIGGDPGVGKSTLLWQVACSIKGSAMYIAGEESPQQIKMRAQRISADFSGVSIVDNPDVSSWLDIVKEQKPTLLVIDSIQTIFDSTIGGAPGSIIQVKHCANKIIRMAKSLSIATVMIGHVTKEGEVAGPRTLEHMVDGVFYLEGDKLQSERFLRSNKNRFGSTEEMGVFVIGEKGMRSASDFGRLKPEETIPFGLSRTAVLEGSRTYVTEVQALLQKSSYGFPKRNSVGFDLNRLLMMIAILSNHAGIDLSDRDVFLNITDGYKLKDPLSDLAVISALASAAIKKPLNGNQIILGEVDLAGRIHLPSQAKKIIKDMQKLGYKVKTLKVLEQKAIFTN